MGVYRLAVFVLSLVVCVSADEDEDAPQETKKYDIICDAGSTGTRMYLFSHVSVGHTDGTAEVKDLQTKVIGKIKPGVHSYAEKPADAVKPLMTLFDKVSKEIPKKHWARTTVTIYATGGLRQMKKDDQEKVIQAIRKGLADHDEYPFQGLKMSILSGHDEGAYAILTVNYLGGRVDSELKMTQKGREKNLLGVLDLGGASTQIAIPPMHLEETREFEKQVEVRSYASFGMEQVRERIDQFAVSKDMKTSPCYFKGYKVPGHNLEGTGNAEECRALMLQQFKKHELECEASVHATAHIHKKILDRQYWECIPGNDNHARHAGALNINYYAVSGYLYVQEFASHWLARKKNTKLQEAGKTPTVTELIAAASDLCASEWSDIEKATKGGQEAGAHRYTDIVKAPHRCLEVNYISVLLHTSYGFEGNENREITFEDEIDGTSVEWPLGAFLHMRHAAKVEASHREEQDEHGKSGDPDSRRHHVLEEHTREDGKGDELPDDYYVHHALNTAAEL